MPQKVIIHVQTRNLYQFGDPLYCNLNLATPWGFSVGSFSFSLSVFIPTIIRSCIWLLSKLICTITYFGQRTYFYMILLIEASGKSFFIYFLVFWLQRQIDKCLSKEDRCPGSLGYCGAWYSEAAWLLLPGLCSFGLSLSNEHRWEYIQGKHAYAVGFAQRSNAEGRCTNWAWTVTHWYPQTYKAPLHDTAWADIKAVTV